MLPSDDLPPTSPPPTPAAPAAEQGWQRLHIASPILNGVATAVRFWPVFLIAVVNEGRGIIGLLIGGAAIVVLAIEVVRYLRFDYRLEGTTLVVRSGVLVRRTRTVPADRVQQVSRSEKLRHRLFAVAEVSVEVAGAGTEPDVKLSVVAAPEADRIRTRLRDARRAVGATRPEPDRVIYEQPNDALARWAAISSPLFALPVIGAVFGVLGDAVDLDQAWGWLPDGSELWFIGVVGIVGLAAATAVTMARFYDMRLVQADDNLRLEYGLLTHRRLELPAERIQALVTKLTPAGRLSRTMGLTAHNASSAGEATNSYLPAVPRGDSSRVVAMLIPGLDLRTPVNGHPRAALRRSVLRWTRPVLLVTVVGWGAVRNVWGILLIFGLVPAAALGWRAWRLLAHAETTDVVLARRGAITEHVTAIRRGRVQSSSVTANWFQRRANLATLQIQVAQPLGRVAIRDMDATEAHDMAERLALRASSVDSTDAGSAGYGT